MTLVLVRPAFLEVDAKHRLLNESLRTACATRAFTDGLRSLSRAA